MEPDVIDDLFKVTKVELIYRSRTKVADRPKVRSARDAYKILKRNWDLNKIELVEQFQILLMDRSGACIGISEISRGGIAGCFVDPKVIFATALTSRASNIILAHNHPSGNLAASLSDIALTRRLCQAGELLDIVVRDHVIVTKEGYLSLADRGLMP
jgi:DNA repair protein RadC